MIYLTRETDISVLQLSARVTNCMRRAKIHTIEAFLDYPEDQFTSIRNLGNTSLEEIVRTRAELRANDGTRFRLVKAEEQQGMSAPAPEAADPRALKTPVLLVDMPISEMKLSVRAMNCLSRVGWTSASQLVGKNLADLLEVKNMGRKTAKEILAAVEQISLQFSAGQPEHRCGAVPTEETALARELADVFGGQNATWFLKLEQLREGEPFDRQKLLDRILREDEIRNALKKAICDDLEAHDDHGTMAATVEHMAAKLVDASTAMALVEELAGEGKIYRTGPILLRLYPSAMDFAESLQDERQKEILLDRLSGKTLEETAAGFNLTRERVRQLQNKALKKRPKLREDRYLPVFGRYFFSREDFRLAFDEPDRFFYYLEMVSGRKQTDTLPLEQALTDESVPVSMRRQIERAVYKKFVTIDGVRILKNRREMVRAVIRRYCREETRYQDFAELYRMQLEDLGLADESSLLLEGGRYENHLRESREILWKPGKCFRYYNIAERDYTELLESLQLERYHDAVLSTLLFFRQYPELMREYDIRDEYELHNLLKKIWGDRKPALDFSRNPIILFGEGSHEKQAMELLQLFSPIGWMELAEKYEEYYGMRANSAASNILSILSDYYHEGVFSLEQKTLPPDRYAALKQRLSGDYYPLREVEGIYLRLFPDGERGDISPYTLKTMGFQVFSGYVVSKQYLNATEYFTKLLTEHDITDLHDIDRELQYYPAFSSTLSHLRQQREIVEFEPHRLIHIRRLESGGVTKAALSDYCDRVLAWVGPDRVFTIGSLRREGFAHDLDDLGFEDWFYSSLLCEDSRFTSRRIGGTRLLHSGERPVTLEDLLIELLLEREKIEIYELVDLLEQEYGIVLGKDKLVWLIKESSLYYDGIMETVYLDYNTYFEEI